MDAIAIAFYVLSATSNMFSIMIIFSRGGIDVDDDDVSAFISFIGGIFLAAFGYGILLRLLYGIDLADGSVSSHLPEVSHLTVCLILFCFSIAGNVFLMWLFGYYFDFNQRNSFIAYDPARQKSKSLLINWIAPMFRKIVVGVVSGVVVFLILASIGIDQGTKITIVGITVAVTVALA